MINLSATVRRGIRVKEGSDGVEIPMVVVHTSHHDVSIVVTDGEMWLTYHDGMLKKLAIPPMVKMTIQKLLTAYTNSQGNHIEIKDNKINISTVKNG